MVGAVPLLWMVELDVPAFGVVALGALVPVDVPFPDGAVLAGTDADGLG
jgi:hypothetical protein